MDILSLLEQYKQVPTANANNDNTAKRGMLSGINDWFNTSANNGTLDIAAYMADELGKRIAPNNVFAGMGSGMAQNRVMQRARKPIEDKGKMMEELLLGMLLGNTKMTPKGMRGPTSVSITPGSDGGLPEYSLKGNFTQGSDWKKNVPFDGGSSAQAQPQGNLYQADDSLSWRENMELVNHKRSLEDMLTGIIAPQESDPASIILSQDQQKQLAAERVAQKQDLYRIAGMLSNERDKQDDREMNAVRMRIAQEKEENRRRIEGRKEARSEELFRLNRAGKHLDINAKQWEAAQRGVKAAKALQEYENSVTSGRNSKLMEQIHAENLAILRDPEVRAATKNKKLMDAAVSESKNKEILERIEAKKSSAKTKEDKDHFGEQKKFMEEWNPEEISKNPYEAHRANMYGAYPVIFAGVGVGTAKAKAVPQTFKITDPKMAFIDSADKLYAYAVQKTGKKRLSMKQFEDFVTDLKDKKVLALEDYKSSDSWYDPIFDFFGDSTKKETVADETDIAYPFEYVDRDEDEDDEDDEEGVEDGDPGSLRERR